MRKLQPQLLGKTQSVKNCFLSSCFNFCQKIKFITVHITMDLKRKAELGAVVPMAKKTRQEVSVYGGDPVSYFLPAKFV